MTDGTGILASHLINLLDLLKDMPDLGDLNHMILNLPDLQMAVFTRLITVAVSEGLQR